MSHHPPHRTGYKYRTCKSCGEKWNVSKKDKSGETYICPICERRRKTQ